MESQFRGSRRSNQHFGREGRRKHPNGTAKKEKKRIKLSDDSLSLEKDLTTEIGNSKWNK